MQRDLESFDGVRIHYQIQTSPSKKWLVFIHGVGSNLTTWDTQRPFFHKQGYSTLAIDLRGHGKSDRPKDAEQYTLDHFAKDINAILEHENIEHCIMIGYCFGGMVSTVFEKLYPQKATAHILIDTSYKAPKRITTVFNRHPYFLYIFNAILKNEPLRKKHFSHLLYDKYKGTGDYNLNRLFANIMHTSLKSWLFTFQNISKYDGIQIMKNMDKPVLIMQGEKDSVFNMDKAKKIHSLIKNSKLQVISGANHILILNNPKEVTQNMYTFLRTLEMG